MPATTRSDPLAVDDAIRAVVARLARPDRDGGAVIERAAIVAEGARAAAIEDWILAHGGEPEALILPPRLGLHTHRDDGFAGRRGARPPRRYVLPAELLDRSS